MVGKADTGFAISDIVDSMLGRALVLTISDTAAAGKREDLSGPEARRILTEVVHTEEAEAA